MRLPGVAGSRSKCLLPHFFFNQWCQDQQFVPKPINKTPKQKCASLLPRSKYFQLFFLHLSTQKFLDLGKPSQVEAVQQLLPEYNARYGGPVAAGSPPPAEVQAVMRHRSVAFLVGIEWVHVLVALGMTFFGTKKGWKFWEFDPIKSQDVLRTVLKGPF